METRVIVADNARARIFTSHDVLKHLVECADFIHGEAHLANRELVTDNAGESRYPRNSLDPATSAKEQETISFAKLLANHLKHMHNEEHFKQLILIAPPKFLGMLRKELANPLDQLVGRTIQKDLTTSSKEEIIKYIRS